MLDGIVQWPKEFQEIYVKKGYWENAAIGETFDRIAGCTLFLQFGMAEGMITMSDPNEPNEMTTIGRPLSPADEVRIVDEEGCDVKAGEVGEMLCRGPYTLRGYFNAPEINARSFTSDGFYRTGDVVRLDPSTGCLVIEGRQKDLINRGGEKISAEEIENLILAHPKVKNAAVVAMPDPVLGERSCAFVILKSNEVMGLEELNNFLREKQMASFKLPERLEAVEAFPLTNVGKVSKKDLRILIEQKLETEKCK
ncbi:MAG: AMP-binding protein [Thermincola sp.]|jgi:2,3-dihydroxybenzoate-AMP ligase|nr:AMP-binding protein [Thermincola sp.]MDT3704139.1 AMP-binding protein [Thermincola sp.]